MMSPRTPRLVTGALVGFLFAAAFATACSKSDNGFDETDKTGFDPADASTDTGECLRQCSLDGRSIVQSCTGAVVETCPADQACGAGICQEPCAAATAERSSNGCEFFLQPPAFAKSLTKGCYAAFVVNTSNAPVDLSVEFKATKLDLSQAVFRTEPGSAKLVPHTGAIAAGESAIVFLADSPDEGSSSSSTSKVIACPDGVVPARIGFDLPDGTGLGSSFHLQSTAPISLSAIFPFGGASSYIPSATLLLPVGTWGTQNVIVNAWERITTTRFFTGRGPSAQIVASMDDTTVTIDPTHAIQDGARVFGTAENVPKSYKLYKGQVLQINQAEELTGSIVTSDKPTSVFGGHECMFVPSDNQACDTALQQLPSFEQWGSEYVGVGYRPRAGDEQEAVPYRIVAARADTRLDYDPEVPSGAPLTLSAGEAVTFWAAAGKAFTVRTQDAEHAIYLASYMTGGTGFNGAGDPEFVNVIPAGQYLNAYSFYADPTYDDTSLVIVRAKAQGEFKDVWLECTGNVTGFQPVGTRGQYEWARVDIAKNGGPGDSVDGGVCQNGLQRMRSDGAFSATLWGWSPWASYAYPGGMAQRKLVQTPLPTVH